MLPPGWCSAHWPGFLARSLSHASSTLAPTGYLRLWSLDRRPEDHPDGRQRASVGGKGLGLRLYLTPHTRRESFPYFTARSPSSWLSSAVQCPPRGELLVGRGHVQALTRRQGDTGGRKVARPSRRGQSRGDSRCALLNQGRVALRRSLDPMEPKHPRQPRREGRPPASSARVGRLSPLGTALSARCWSVPGRAPSSG